MRVSIPRTFMSWLVSSTTVGTRIRVSLVSIYRTVSTVANLEPPLVEYQSFNPKY